MTQAPPGTPFLAAAALAGDLEDWGPLAESTGAPMQTSGLTLWSDGDQEVGVWECTPGPSHWTGRRSPGRGRMGKRWPGSDDTERF